MTASPFTVQIAPDYEELIACLRRHGTPRRAHFIELFLDAEVQEAITARYGLDDGLDPADPWRAEKKMIALQRFLGYDHIEIWPEGIDYSFNMVTAADTAELAHAGGRGYVDEHKGPITTWEEFEKYPWPDPAKVTTRALEWYEKNLPEDMCIIAGHLGHFYENLSFLMGYETLSMALFLDRELVRAVADRIFELEKKVIEVTLQFDRVKAVWGSDDMGFRTGTLISPADLREFVLPGHKHHAQKSHEAGRPYMLHSCGQLGDIMPDLIEDVKLDAKHSFEDTIWTAEEFMGRWGERLTILGGIDVDFLCRASEEQIRARVRRTLETCLPGGGIVLGSGNSIANYVPIENYLIMLDEGRRFGRS